MASHRACIDRFVLGSVLLCAVATTAAAGAEPKLRLKHGPKAAGQYIVVFADDASVDQLAPDLARQHGGRLTRTFRHALRGAVIADMSEGRARALADDPRVRWVEEDAVVNAAGVDDPANSWGLDRIDQQTSALDARYYYDFTGAGVTVYVIDTGIRTTHAEFGGRASWGDNFVDSYDLDCNGHGTHVAGTIGARRFGVAKGVSLVAVKVLGCNGSGLTSEVVAAIDWIRTNAVHPAVANMSLGGEASDAMDLAIASSVGAGIVYTAAAGNSWSDACTLSPAGAPEAITVGATAGINYPGGILTEDWMTTGSNHGPCVDVYAPGDQILSTYASSDVATGLGSGTSMAAPHAAGVAALLREEFPAADAYEIGDLLLQRAELGYVRGLEPWMLTANRLLQSRTASMRHLQVARDGEGLGTIGSEPPVIDCGATCHATVAPGTPIELVADPAADSHFVGWSGACAGTGPCLLPMDQSSAVRARFNKLFSTLNVRLLAWGTASGTVTSSPAGIDCGGDCAEDYPDGAIVTLTGHPAADSYVLLWEVDNYGGAAQNMNTFQVQMERTKTVTAQFATYPVDLAVLFAGSGSGTVTIDPRGTVCDQNCHEFSHWNREITLRAASGAGSCFIGWSGDCSPNGGQCTLTTSNSEPNPTVTATFESSSSPLCALFEDGFETGSLGHWGAATS